MRTGSSAVGLALSWRLTIVVGGREVRVRVAGAQEIVRPRRLIGRSVRLLNFTVRRHPRRCANQEAT